MVGADLTGFPPSDLAGLVRAISSEPGRHIGVPGTLNFRDAGGYPAEGGAVIRRGVLYRSDSLHRVDGAAADVLGALGLRTVLDLRTSAEAQLALSPVDRLAGYGALTMSVSLIGEDMSLLPSTLGEIYDFIIDRQGQAVGAAIRCLARPGALPALVHCAAGKDRTGILVALVLAAAGVPDHIIAADYALTSIYLDPQHTPTIGLMRESTGMGDLLTAALLASPPDLLLRTLARARQRGGSIAGYLAGCGVSEAELSALRSAVLADGSQAGHGTKERDATSSDDHFDA